MLLDYQKRWVLDRSPMKVAVKSRQIGLTYATAYEAVEVAAMRSQDGGSDFWYQCFDENTTKEFIEDVAKWAKGFELAYQITHEKIDGEAAQEHYILAGREAVSVTSVRFASGHKVAGLSHQPHKIRSRNGVWCLDEGSYHGDLEGAIEAAGAFAVWGGRSMIISSIGNEDHPFAELVAKIRAREGVYATYSLHQTTIHEAIADGLYKMVCDVKLRIPWTAEGEREWLAGLLAQPAAEREYLCVPGRRGSESVFSPRDWCDFVEAPPPASWVTRSVRAWDRAATKPSKQTRDPDWTRGLKLQWTRDGALWITDGIGLRDTPGAVTDAIRQAALLDGIGTTVALWQDPGAAGKYEAEDMVTRQLAGFDVHVEPAREAKQTYWRPVATAMRPLPGASRGQIRIVRGPWTEDLCAELARCPNGQHDDWADALALAFMVGSGTADRFEVHTAPRRRAATL